MLINLLIAIFSNTYADSTARSGLVSLLSELFKKQYYFAEYFKMIVLVPVVSEVKSKLNTLPLLMSLSQVLFTRLSELML